MIIDMSKSLNFEYSMSLDFSHPVNNHKFTLRMIPCSDDRQQITTYHVNIEPLCELHNGQDTFGNSYIFGEIKEAHTRFSVTVNGVAIVSADKQITVDKSMIMLAPFRFPSQYTKPGPHINEYFDIQKQRTYENTYDFCARIMHQINNDMVYSKGVTDINTTAEQAFEKRQGVCQDYAHIMLALCRMQNIPCRYVVGMMQGEGVSHAWVEICANGIWYGMDPTNDKLVDDTYIKISHGRDYKDCIVNRGVFTGIGTQTQSVHVNVNFNE